MAIFNSYVKLPEGIPILNSSQVLNPLAMNVELERSSYPTRHATDLSAEVVPKKKVPGDRRQMLKSYGRMENLAENLA
jgi:hypothetical protein